jgi:hypothetical protein
VLHCGVRGHLSRECPKRRKEEALYGNADNEPLSRRSCRAGRTFASHGNWPSPAPPPPAAAPASRRRHLRQRRRPPLSSSPSCLPSPPFSPHHNTVGRPWSPPTGCVGRSLPRPRVYWRRPRGPLRRVPPRCYPTAAVAPFGAPGSSAASPAPAGSSSAALLGTPPLLRFWAREDDVADASVAASPPPQGFFTVGFRAAYRGNRSYRWGTVTVPAVGTDKIQI